MPQQPQDDPYLAAAKRRAAQAAAPADPFLAAAKRIAAPTDTTLGPEGIRASDTDARERYLQQSDSLSRRAEAHRDSTLGGVPPAVRDMHPTPTRVPTSYDRFGEPQYAQD